MDPTQDRSRVVSTASEPVGAQPDDIFDQLYINYSKAEDLAGLEKAIEASRQAHAIMKTHNKWPVHLYYLGSGLYHRYQITLETADIEEAVSFMRQAVDVEPVDSPEWPNYSFALALFLGVVYNHTGDAADLEEPIELLRASVSSTSTEHLAGRAGNLGLFLKQRYWATENEDDLKDASKALTEALGLSPGRLAWLEALIDVYEAWFVATKRLEHVEEMERLLRRVLSYDGDGLDKPKLHSRLATTLEHQYLLTKKHVKLKESIEAEMHALRETLKSDTEAPTRIKNLSRRLYELYGETEEVKSLEASVKFGRMFFNVASEHHPDWVTELNNLCVYLGCRYDVFGKQDDLEEAIQSARKGLAVTPAVDAQWTRLSSNLATQLTARFKLTGAANDLDEAISLHRQAIDKLDTVRSVNLHNLATALIAKYTRSNDIINIDEAVELGKKALELAEEDDPNIPLYLSDIVRGLSHRYTRLGKVEDLDEGIKLGGREAFEAQDTHINGSTRFKSLATLLDAKFKISGSMEDLDEAIDLTRKCIALTSEEDPEKGGHFATLGSLYMRKLDRTLDEVDRLAAITYYKAAVVHPHSKTLQRIAAASSGIQLCYLHPQLAYDMGVPALEMVTPFLGRSLETSDRQYLMTQAVGLASSTAAAALQLGKSPLHALSLLELGRGVLGSSLEEMRMDVLDLRKKHPELADEFARLRDELDMPSLASDIACNGDPVLDTRGNQRHVAGKALDALLGKIREQPGFEAFLGPLAPEDVQAAAEHGPLAVVNVSPMGCDAILLERHQVRAISLNVTENEISDKALGGNLGGAQTLNWLWDAITGPVLEALGFTQTPLEHWPRVWWIPTGPLCKFPLYASGYHDGGSKTVIDRVMSSYGSSVKSIVYGRRRRLVQSDAPRVLLVAMETTLGHPPLPYAAKEVAAIDTVFGSTVFNTVQPGRSKEDILPRLKGCQIFHFAGHSYTDAHDPSQSHLCLDQKDDALTVANLFDMNLYQHSPFLAYLSACGTGRIRDDKFLDESIHIVSACQLAGFRHVIGTMWEVNDEYCVDVARMTYESLRDEGMTDEAVCRGLHRATRLLRDCWLKNRDGEAGALARDMERLGESKMGSHREPRDIECSDDDDEDDEAAAYWVPYVHYGV